MELLTVRRGGWGIAVLLSAVTGCTELRMTPPETGSAGAGGTTAGTGGGTGGTAGTDGTAGTGDMGGSTATGGNGGGGTGGGVAGASAGGGGGAGGVGGRGGTGGGGGRGGTGFGFGGRGGTGGGGRGGTGGGGGRGGTSVGGTGGGVGGTSGGVGGTGGFGGTSGVGGTGGGVGGTGGSVGGTGGVLPEPPGLIAFWRFNEATGTTVADSSANGQSLTLSSSARWTQLGHEGAAYAFDGSTDVAGVTPQSSQPLASLDIPMTMSAWIRPDAAAAARPFATVVGRAHEDFLFQNFWLGLISGKPACTIHSPEMEGAIATVVAPAGVWTHIACTYGLSGDAILYVNGVQVASFATVQDIGPIPTGVLVGASETTDLHDYFPGAIDDVRMYTITLTPSQITAIFK